MLQNTVRTLLPSIVVTSLALAVMIAPMVFGTESAIQGGADAARGVDQTETLFGAQGIFSTITNVLLFVLGAVSVIMIIIGGLRYIVSGGNATAVTAAKNTILYAIVGVIVALLAYAIVNFVLQSFSGGASSGGTNV